MNRTEIDRNFIIEHHLSQKKKWKKKLVPYSKMKTLINDEAILNECLERMDKFESDTLWLRIRDRLAFNIRWR